MVYFDTLTGSLRHATLSSSSTRGARSGSGGSGGSASSAVGSCRSSGCLLRFGFITRATDLPLLEAIAGPSDSGKRLYDFRALGG